MDKEITARFSGPRGCLEPKSRINRHRMRAMRRGEIPLTDKSLSAYPATLINIDEDDHVDSGR